MQVLLVYLNGRSYAHSAQCSVKVEEALNARVGGVDRRRCDRKHRACVRTSARDPLKGETPGLLLQVRDGYNVAF